MKIKTRFFNKAKHALKRALTIPSRIADKVESGFKAQADAKRQRNTKLIEKNFGSTHQYDEFMGREKQKRAMKKIRGF